MNLEELKASNRIIFECIAGSRLYGTTLKDGSSDTDIRGFYINPSTEYLNLKRKEPEPQINDEKHDVVYYSLKRAFELLEESNPNFIELLSVPEDCIRIKTPIMDELIANRHLFISKRAYDSHIGYAIAQLKKCRGANKMVNHPEMFTKPVKEDFCWIIRDMDSRIKLDQMPCRPIPLKSVGEMFGSINDYHVSALEHVPNTYRLYYYGADSKGVFRGDDMLVCESIPFDDEKKRFVGLLIYNKHEYEKAMEQHRKYKIWQKERNKSRWIDQENKVVDFDCKNLMHTFRLLLSGENILLNGCPIVRFYGHQHEFLMKIRRAEFKYEKLIEKVDEKMVKLKELYEASTLPDSVDGEKIEELYRRLSSMHV